MITLITGAPGTGKTAALVSLLSELGKNRAIYCDGIPDLKLDHVDLTDPTKWPDTVPDGSIIVIDEVQRIWRPRGPGSKVPLEIAALETHRHRGLDFYVITQSPRLLDTNVRALVGRHVHLRDLGLIGRFWYEWPECADQCSTTWKSAPLKKRYRLPKAIFSTYKSASEHIKPVRSIPWMVGVLALALLVTAGLAYKSYSVISSKVAPAPELSKKPQTLDDITSRGATVAHVSEVLPYDTTSFIPRVSSKPESAPAYDHLRVVVAMPVVAGGICFGAKCKCLTQQGSDSGLSSDECRLWIAAAPFDPYRQPVVAGAPASAVSPPQNETRQNPEEAYDQRSVADGVVLASMERKPPPQAVPPDSHKQTWLRP